MGRCQPNQLLVALIGELGELSEHYQWQDTVPAWGEEKRREVGYEFVDVLFYLLRLAHASGIDVGHYFDEKLPRLEEKPGQNPRTHMGRAPIRLQSAKRARE